MASRRPNRFFSIVLALVAWSVNAADRADTTRGIDSDRLATVRIYYHEAAELAARLNALFEPDELKASGLGHDIILRADSVARLNDAKALVAELDRKPAQFRISVREASQGSDQGQQLGIQVISGRQDPSGQVRNDISLNHGNRRYSTRNQSEQTVIVLEGHAVSLIAGQLRPSGMLLISSDGLVMGSSGQRELIGSELLVTPTLTGPETEPRARIAIAVGKQRDRRNAGSLDAFELTSTQLLELDRWTPLGSVSNTMGGHGNANAGTNYRTDASNLTQGYEIMIQLLN